MSARTEQDAQARKGAAGRCRGSDAGPGGGLRRRRGRRAPRAPTTTRSPARSRASDGWRLGRHLEGDQQRDHHGDDHRVQPDVCRRRWARTLNGSQTQDVHRDRDHRSRRALVNLDADGASGCGTARTSTPPTRRLGRGGRVHRRLQVHDGDGADRARSSTTAVRATPASVPSRAVPWTVEDQHRRQPHRDRQPGLRVHQRPDHGHLSRSRRTATRRARWRSRAFRSSTTAARATPGYGTVPAGQWTSVVNPDGSLTITANPGYAFPNGQQSVTLPVPTDSNVACPTPPVTPPVVTPPVVTPPVVDAARGAARAGARREGRRPQHRQVRSRRATSSRSPSAPASSTRPTARCSARASGSRRAPARSPSARAPPTRPTSCRASRSGS